MLVRACAAVMLSVLCVPQAHALAMAASAPAGAAIPYMPDGPGVTSLALRVLGALLVCALAGWGLIQLLRTRHAGGVGRAGAGRKLDVLEVRALGGRSRLLVVRYEGRQLLLAQHETGIALLSEGAFSSGENA